MALFHHKKKVCLRRSRLSTVRMELRPQSSLQNMSLLPNLAIFYDSVLYQVLRCPSPIPQLSLNVSDIGGTL